MKAKVAYVARRTRLLPRFTRDKIRSARLRSTAIGKLAAKEREWDAPLRLRQPRWWRKGFLSRSATLYQLDERGPEGYVSDLQRVYRTRRMVHPRLQDVINNKLTTHLLLGAMDVRSARLLGVYWRGAVHRFPGEERLELTDYIRSLEIGEQVFVKLIAGAEGRNIYSVRRDDADRWEVSGELLSADEAAAVLHHKRPMIVEEGLVQHAKQAALFPGSVNTVRVLTVPDVADGYRPFIAVAVQRIGTRRSEPVDNWTQGGLSAEVDLDTGQLSPASRLPDSKELEWFDSHPDTGAPIEGVVVPFWPEVKQMVVHAARVLSFMEYVGWDIVITPDGPVVLEANINTGMNVLQVHKPLLADPRVRAYYAERGVTDLPLDDPPPVDVTDPV